MEYKKHIEERKAVDIDEAYEMVGPSGLYQSLLALSGFLTTVTCLVYVFSVPLFEVFPEVTGCPEGRCKTAEQACRNHYSYSNKGFNFMSQFDLICSDFKAALIPFAYCLGGMPACIFVSMLSDSYGRLPVIIGGVSGCFVSLGMIMILENYYATLFFSFLLGFCGVSSGLPSYPLIYDSVKTNLVAFYGTFLGFSFGFGEVLVGLLNWTGLSWKKISIFFLGWYVLFFIFLIWLREPPRYLLSKGKEDQAMKNLRHIAKINGKIMPENLKIEQGDLLSRQAVSMREMFNMLGERWILKKISYYFLKELLIPIFIGLFVIVSLSPS